MQHNHTISNIQDLRTVAQVFLLLFSSSNLSLWSPWSSPLARFRFLFKVHEIFTFKHLSTVSPTAKIVNRVLSQCTGVDSTIPQNYLTHQHSLSQHFLVEHSNYFKPDLFHSHCCDNIWYPLLTPSFFSHRKGAELITHQKLARNDLVCSGIGKVWALTVTEGWTSLYLHG
jgi:hypothetical protein